MINVNYNKQVLLNAQQRSARYFYYIGGFTLVNTALLYAKAKFVFLFSLGIVDIAESIISDQTIAVGFAVIMAAIFALFGFLAAKGNVAVFIVGMVLYTLDGVLLVLLKDWLAVAVHAYILYQLYRGVTYSLTLKKVIEKELEEERRQRFANAASGQSRP